MNNIEDRLNKLEDKIKDEQFKTNKGLGNEVGYYIFDYPPEEELLIREKIINLEKKYRGKETKIVVFDLYDIIIEILEKEYFFDACVKFEGKKGFQEIVSAVNELLRMEEDNEKNELLLYMKKDIPKESIIFLTGIGKCYPILRSHKILNNMHQYIDEVPVIMFFPGIYDGQSLVLFGEIKDDNYYRAFRIVD